MPSGPTQPERLDGVDREIHQRLLRKDSEGLSMLLHNYGDLVRSRLSFDFPNFGDDDLDEALQRGLLKVWSYAHAFDPQKAPLRGWFTVICRRVAVDHLAERSRAGGEQYEAWDLVPAPERRPSNPVVSLVRQAIETLAPLQRAVVEADLADPGAKAPAEPIAASLATTVGAVYNARKKARKALAKRLGSLGIASETLFDRSDDESDEVAMGADTP